MPKSLKKRTLTLTITYDPYEAEDPIGWNYEELFDLGAEEKVEVVSWVEDETGTEL